MAFSMFFRTPACTRRIISQQVMKLVTQPSVAQASALRVLPKNLVVTESKTPLLNSVRQFRTTMIRRSEEKAHDHAKLWIIEKATSAILVPLIPVALLMPNKILDSVLAILVTAHSFWGLEAMVVEYVRVLLFGPVIPKFAMAVVYLLTVMQLGGLFYLIFNDVGLSRSFWKIWNSLKSKSPPPPAASGSKTPPKVYFVGGLEAVVVDYVRASIFGPFIPKLAVGLVYLLSITTLGGLFYLISHDIGIANVFRQLWAIKSSSQQNA